MRVTEHPSHCCRVSPSNRHVAEAAVRWVPATMLLLREHVSDGGDGVAAVRGLLTFQELSYIEVKGAGGHEGGSEW